MKLSEKIFVAKVTGRSMKPLFDENDIVFVRKIALLSSRRGDIVVYKEAANSLVHRCIRIIKSQSGAHLFAKGDNLLYVDSSAITEKEFLGKVVGFTKSNKILSCENLPWKIVNLVLGELSVFQLYTVLTTDKLKKRLPRSIIYICLRVPLILIFNAIEKLRYALVKLLIRFTLLLS